MRFVERLNTPVAVVAVLLLLLAVDGFLFYRYQQSLTYAGDAAVRMPAGIGSAAGDKATATAESTASGDATERTDETAAFVHRAALQNIVGNSTYIDHPLANGNPNAFILITQGSGSDGDVYDDHPVGVWYDANRGGRWAIFNQDLAPMPEGAAFDVAVLEEPGGAVFVHRATPANTVVNGTYLDHPSTNGNLDVVLAVTPNWNPDGGAGTYNDHPVGVRYDADEEKWVILNQDLGPMPEGAAFNVAVSDGATTTR